MLKVNLGLNRKFKAKVKVSKTRSLFYTNLKRSWLTSFDTWKMLQNYIRRTMTTSIQDSKIAKKSLRKQMKAKVATISQQEKKLQSKIVTGKVLNSAEYVNSKSIALYLHMDDEIQTEDILIQAFKDEKICYIPR